MSRTIKTLGAIIADVRSETGRSRSVNFGKGEFESIKYLVQREQLRLWWDTDWEFLRRIEPLTLNAGQRYYDAPGDICIERITRAQVLFGSDYCDLTKGVGMEQYSLFNSDDDVRQDPAERWGVRNTGATDQIEIWPIPVAEQTSKWSGIKNLAEFVEEDANCTLDATLITLFTAAIIKPDKPDLLGAANRLLAKLIGHGARQTPNNSVSMKGRDSAPAQWPRTRIIAVHSD